MNTYNISTKQEQEQRLANDRAAVEDQIEKLTDLYNQGISDAAFGVDPVHPEIQEYWQGYSEEKRRYWVKKNKPMPSDLYGKEFQGYLYSSVWHISKKYGELSAIGQDKDYKGWEIEIEGLEIELATTDWEEAEKETKWSIYSHHVGSLELLANEFGQENICDGKVEDVFGDQGVAA